MKAIPLLVISALVFVAGTNGASQAITSTVQLTQQSMQNTKNASETQSAHAKQNGLKQGGTSQQGNIQAYVDSHRTGPDCHCADQPFFSLNSSDVAAGTEISISSTDPDAAIYYTTDGWTPTNASTRYSGPITINATTRLQAIAIVPQKLPSPVLEADYLVNGPATSISADVVAEGGILTKGTPFRLVTASRVTSETANVGDHIAILLDQNLSPEARLWLREVCQSKPLSRGSSEQAEGASREWSFSRLIRSRPTALQFRSAAFLPWLPLMSALRRGEFQTL